MTDKEKEAVGRIKYNDITKPLACGDLTICNIEDLETVLNLIQKQQDKINKAIEYIEKLETFNGKNYGVFSMYETEKNEILKILRGEDNV